jgi:hypothetical protein
MDEIQVIIDNFVKKNLNIAGKRITDTVDNGGLGLFNLKDFLAAQRCMWLCRAFRIQNDNWTFDIKNAAPDNNILLIKPCDINRNLNPILYSIVEDYRYLYGCFSKTDGNYKKCYIFDNPSITMGPDYTILLGSSSTTPTNLN